MGAANVIPGVSGGTIAFITGIYERLIAALRRFDLETVRLASRLRIREVVERVDLVFLAVLGAGVFTSLLTFGRILKGLFHDHPTGTWAFFFGLILASIFFVGRIVRRWSAGPVAAAAAGTLVAAGIAFLRPAGENDAFLYLVLCGVVAICSMIVPGLSGSFVLILMGNYALVMLDAVPSLDLRILVPVGIGAVVGILAFARLLDWVFRHHHDTAVALLTGFVSGSLATIWPWKVAVPLLDAAGDPVVRKGKEVVAGYDWQAPPLTDPSTWAALALVAFGIGLVFAIEWAGKRAVAGRTG